MLVVGPGTTGSEVAALLARGGAGRVRVACRTPPNLITRKILGASINVHGLVLERLPLRVADQIAWLSQRILFGDLDRYGLPRSPIGLATLSRRQKRRPTTVGSSASSRPDGSRSSPRSRASTARACCSPTDADPAGRSDRGDGYRRGLEPLVGHLGVLDEDGKPLVGGGKQHPSAPGLFFNGYRSDLSGQLRLDASRRSGDRTSGKETAVLEVAHPASRISRTASARLV